MAELEDETQTPYYYKNAPGLSLIVLMRLYDVQLALLNETNPEVADMIYGVHQKGGIVSDLPHYDPEA